MRPAADNIAAIPGRCAICGRELVWLGRGRITVTCSPAHRQELYRRRRAARADAHFADRAVVGPGVLRNG